MRDNFSWPKTEPIGQPAAKSFPKDALPPVLRDMALAVAEHTQTPPDMAAAAIVGVIAACAQGKFLVEGKRGYWEPLNLYILLVALSGERKSGIYRPVTTFCYEWEKLYNECHAPEIERYQDELELLDSEAATIKKSKLPHNERSQRLEENRAERRLLKPAKPKRIIYDDATPEAQATALCENDERGAVFSTESGLLDSFGRYTQTVNFDLYLKAYSGDPVRINRRGREETLHHPALTILCCAQPHVIEELTKNNAYRGRGLLARFLYCFPESVLGERRYDTAPIPLKVEAAYRNLVFELLDIPQPDKPHIIHLSDEACGVHRRFFDIIEGEMTGRLAHIADFAAKLPGVVLRIAGLIHVVQHLQSAHDERITGDTMNCAVKLGYYFLAHALKTFAYAGVDEQANAAQYVVKRLTKAPALNLSRSDIHSLCRGRFDKIDSLLPVLKHLISLGYLREIPADRTATTGRKPDSRYELNPLFFKEVD